MAAARKPVAHAAASRKPPVRKASARGPLRGWLARNGASRNELRLAGAGTEAVMRATGRPWSEWLAVLDRAGARAMAHKDIALLLSRKFGVPDWWGQMVTVGYEQARGLRAAHGRLRSAASARTQKAFWAAALDRLKALLESGR